MAFQMPGGEASDRVRRRPIDMEHLSRQTMGDRGVESEVLDLFIHQISGLCDLLEAADLNERRRLAHGLKGAARAVGAFAIADCADRIEAGSDTAAAIRRLDRLVAEVQDFVASIGR